MRLLLDIDISKYGYRFTTDLENILNRELSKKKHSWDFKRIKYIRQLTEEENLSVEFVDALINLVQDKIQDHIDYDH